MVPIKPGSRALGQPGSTESPGAAPGKEKVISPQPAAAMFAKASADESGDEGGYGRGVDGNLVWEPA
jgi:hypothetical protein